MVKGWKRCDVDSEGASSFINYSIREPIEIFHGGVVVI